jgi:hypothetical protein
MTRPRRGDDQAVDPAGEDQPRECLVRLLLVVVVGEEHREVALRRPGEGAADDVRIDGVHEGRDEHPDRAGLRTPEAPRERVRAVSEVPRGGEDALPQRLPDRQGRIGVDDARCDRRRSTRRARDVDEPARAAGGKALPGATSA